MPCGPLAPPSGRPRAIRARAACALAARAETLASRSRRAASRSHRRLVLDADPGTSDSRYLRMSLALGRGRTVGGRKVGRWGGSPKDKNWANFAP